MKNKIIILVLLISLILISGCGKNKNDSKYTIVTTSFPGFDFARAITEETDFNVIMLIKPGSEMHHYEPTPQDIINIEKSDLFIYVGGDSDSWIEDVLKDIDTKKTKIIKLMDLVNVVEEETVEGMEEEEEEEEIEYDEDGHGDYGFHTRDGDNETVYDMFGNFYQLDMWFIGEATPYSSFSEAVDDFRSGCLHDGGIDDDLRKEGVTDIEDYAEGFTAFAMSICPNYVDE